MVLFKKYSSIENSYAREFMERIAQVLPQDLEWVVQEKVHGACTSFIYDGNELRFASRTMPLNPEDKFYNYQELVERYRTKVENLFGRIKEKYPEVTSISVFGEMFGGSYKHPNVAAVKGTSAIQKGVFYTPGHEFYGFDIYVSLPDGGRYLTVDETNSLFEAEGFVYAQTLLRGSLDECLKHPNDFESKIAGWLGLPPIADNICEGVVIRPVIPQYLPNGSRVLIKNKNQAFSERKAQKVRNKIFKEPVPYSEALQELIAEVETYVTANRLSNVMSHIGEVSLPKDFGRIMGLFSKDVLEDFMKEQGGRFLSLDKCEQKSLTKEMNKFCTDLVKSELMSKAYLPH